MRSVFFVVIFFYCQLCCAQISNSLTPYRLGDKWGYANAKREIVIPAIYDDASLFEDGLACVVLKNKTALIDQLNNIVIPFGDSRYTKVTSELFIKHELTYPNGSTIPIINVGVINSKNEVVIPCIYRSIRSLHGVFDIQGRDEKRGIYSYDGKILIPVDNDFIRYVGSSLCVLERNGLQALYTTSGKKITDFKYIVIQGYRNNLSKIRVEDNFGFIDMKGMELIPPIYGMVYPFSNGFAVVRVGEKYGLIDTLGNSIIEAKYDFLGDVHLGVISAMINGNWGLLDSTGKQITSFGFQQITRVYNGAIMVKQNDKWGVANPKGQMLTGFVFDTMKITENTEYHYRFFEADDLKYDLGYILVSRNEKWGVVKDNGEVILKTEYDEIYRYTNGVAIVRKMNKWAVADSMGNFHSDFVYDKLEPYLAGDDNLKEDGIVLYNRSGKWGILNKNGTEITSADYDFIKQKGRKLYLVDKEKKSGVIDFTGRIVVPVKYDRIKFLGNTNLFLIELNGKKGYVNDRGEEFFE